jgi:hypothetical protein
VSAQSPFDRTKARFEIRREVKDDMHFALVFWIIDGDPPETHQDICVTKINPPTVDTGPRGQVPDGYYEQLAARQQLEWLVGSAATFHKVEVHNYLDNTEHPLITHVFTKE